MEYLLNSTIIELVKRDITQSDLECIVNAANTSLLGGGGVDGAIHRAGGKEILDECIRIRNKQGNCPVGEAVITTAGKLKANFVIHTVGPVWNGGNNKENEKLSNCYKNTLNLALLNGIKSISFPNISTGIYKFPKDKAAEIAIKTVKGFVELNNSFNRIQFICFDDENYNIYQETLSAVL
ncbi:macro domain-containing protein [Paenibacillus baekrokdamisoli]|uniref:Macro domain-containing protein n=1 Tax=Paenibacillus baekrokdamisoli TaxID=1712516 RepID=A0A3G9J1K3_9BACL|nr:O-acetyl-ADP-ribose deacetylase [Paenibacillus baekrokdamisoli]MBB3072884.1 O-acetyl-ADP-ribose deacetylase (regulator of RNase III) [Paenibacillus baekrokdamisoli]BBH24442.1 macro domain-containing protein [Paenibacillus baekrokdamisoli]